MKRSLALLTFVAAPLLAADTYTVRIPMFPAVGKSVRTVEKNKMRAVAKITDAGGGAIGTREMNDDSETVYLETRVSEGKVVRFYELARTKGDEGETHEPFENHKLTFSLAPVSVKPEAGRSVDPAALKKLEESFRSAVDMNRKNICIPTTPLKVGAEWTVNADDANICFNPFAREAKSAGATARGKLVSVTPRNGVHYARVEFTATVPLMAVGPLSFAEAADLNESVNFEVPLDGSSVGRVTYSGTIAGTTAPHPENGSRLRIEFQMSGETVTTAR